MKKILTIFFAIVLGTFISSSIYAAKHPTTGETLSVDQTFTYWALDEHSSIDPQIVEDVSGSDIIRDLFEGLLNQDADGNLVPGVAESWSANDSKDIYTFNLRKNAKWSNGDPVTAYDIISWDLKLGDAIAFNFATIHGAPENKSNKIRRAFSARFTGDDATFAKRKGEISPPFPEVKLNHGDKMDCPTFPEIPI